MNKRKYLINYSILISIYFVAVTISLIYCHFLPYHNSSYSFYKPVADEGPSGYVPTFLFIISNLGLLIYFIFISIYFYKNEQNKALFFDLWVPTSIFLVSLISFNHANLYFFVKKDIVLSNFISLYSETSDYLFKLLSHITATIFVIELFSFIFKTKNSLFVSKTDQVLCIVSFSLMSLNFIGETMHSNETAARIVTGLTPWYKIYLVLTVLFYISKIIFLAIARIINLLKENI